MMVNGIDVKVDPNSYWVGHGVGTLIGIAAGYIIGNEIAKRTHVKHEAVIQRHVDKGVDEIKKALGL